MIKWFSQISLNTFAKIMNDNLSKSANLKAFQYMPCLSFVTITVVKCHILNVRCKDYNMIVK